MKLREGIRYKVLIMKRVALDILIIVLALIVIGSALVFKNGSLEMYPTEEQIEKARIVATVVGIISIFLEIFLIRLRVKK